METGRTVILLNLDEVYDSLYDALNQVCLIFWDIKPCTTYSARFCIYKHFRSSMFNSANTRPHSIQFLRTQGSDICELKVGRNIVN